MRYSSTAMVVALMVVPGLATASDHPASYYAQAEGNTVTICPQQRNGRACPQREGMLRQEVGSGKVVRLPQNCTNRRVSPPGSSDANRGACYLDSCVPPGTYRYGYATPLECTGESTFYFAQVTVTQKVPQGCSRSTRGSVTEVKHAPWGSSPYICAAGCSRELNPQPEVTWGLILLLIAGASVAVVMRRSRRSA